MEKTLEVLRAVRACEEDAQRGWALDWSLTALRRRVGVLVGQGLLVVADRETRAELSAWEGRPVRWAVRLSAIGHDVIAFARSQPAPARSEPAADARVVELLPSQMVVMQMYIGLFRAGEISVQPAEGLAEQVRDAVHDRGAGRWRLHLTAVQMRSVAYAFWLHQMTGSAAGARRFSRDYGLAYRPDAPAAQTGPEHSNQPR
ncbi:DUF6417 family protein [Streptomyces sp. NPDC051985]|uniref:DUF6417 family protein n=1 Tax=Streptomyces sp. NPDC051985 TaxID=3155807 RepID=UPI003424D1B2